MEEISCLFKQLLTYSDAAGICRAIAEMVAHELFSVFLTILSCIDMISCALQSKLFSIYSHYMFLSNLFSPFLP